MSLFDRFVQVVRANLNSIVQEAEDPEKTIETMIEKLDEQLISQRQSIAQAIALQKRTERQSKQHQAQAEEWHRRAKLALVQQQEQLAKEYLRQRQSHLEQAQLLDTQIAAQLKIISQLKEQLRLLEIKVAEMKLKKDLYIAKARSATTAQALAQLNNNDVLEKIEQKILALEAEAELHFDPLEAKFKDLEVNHQIETEEIKRLRAEIENI